MGSTKWTAQWYPRVAFLVANFQLKPVCLQYWAEARVKIARMTLTIKLDGNWNSFQLANSTPPLCVTDSAIAPSARMANSLSQLTYM